jgi:hypothetical protein
LEVHHLTKKCSKTAVLQDSKTLLLKDNIAAIQHCTKIALLAGSTASTVANSI